MSIVSLKKVNNTIVVIRENSTHEYHKSMLYGIPMGDKLKVKTIEEDPVIGMIHYSQWNIDGNKFKSVNELINAFNTLIK